MGFEDLLYTGFSRPPLLQLYLLPILLLLRLTLTELTAWIWSEVPEVHWRRKTQLRVLIKLFQV